jgi:hypothetical protein
MRVDSVELETKVFIVAQLKFSSARIIHTSSAKIKK